MSLTKVSYSMTLGQKFNVFDYMTAAQIADVQSGALAVNVTAAVQAAIDDARNSAGISVGMHELFFPKGVYRIDSQLVVTAQLGVTFTGEGPRASILYYNTPTGALFNFTNYVQFYFANLGFRADYSNPTRTNVCFKLNGTGGGTYTHLDFCQVDGFATAIETKQATGNDDLWFASNCSFQYCKRVWDNTNQQAVNWVFDSCQMMFISDINFNNPGSYLRVINGDYISPSFFISLSLDGFGTGIVVQNVKFETFQNIDPTSNPKWFVMSGTANVGNVVFENCSDFSASIGSKTVFNFANLFDITFRNCQFEGTMAINANSSFGGVMSKVQFYSCPLMPTIVQTLSPSQGNTPVSLFYDGAEKSGYMERFVGLNANAANIIPFKQKIVFQALPVSAVAVGTGFNLDLPVGGNFILTGVEMVYSDSVAVAATVTLYPTSAKASILYQYAKAASTGLKVDSATLNNGTYPLTNTFDFTSASAPIYMEILPASTFGGAQPLVSMILTFADVY